MNNITSLLINYKTDVPDGPTWDGITNDLWQNILKQYIFEIANGFSFEKVQDQKCLENKIALFKFVDDIQINHSSCLNSGGTSIFNLCSNAKKVIQFPEFSDWDVINDDLPFEELNFYIEKELIVKAIPYESEIQFYDLDKNLTNALIKIDPIIKKNLVT